MAAQREMVVVEMGGQQLNRDEANTKSPMGKKFKPEKFLQLWWEFAAALGVFLMFSTGLFCTTSPCQQLNMGISDCPALCLNFVCLTSKTQREIAKLHALFKSYPIIAKLFINLASPIVDIPFHIFFLATVLGLIPSSFITVKAGLAIGDLKFVKDLYDFKTLSVLFLIGLLFLFPTLLKRKRIYE